MQPSFSKPVPFIEHFQDFVECRDRRHDDDLRRAELIRVGALHYAHLAGDDGLWNQSVVLITNGESEKEIRQQLHGLGLYTASRSEAFQQVVRNRPKKDTNLTTAAHRTNRHREQASASRQSLCVAVTGLFGIVSERIVAPTIRCE